VIGIAAANRDPAVWGDDADEWRAERWIDHGLHELVKERQVHIPEFARMTFLGGGRACIGFKFSELEMKVVLSTLLEPNLDIMWRNSNVATPTTKGREKDTPHLPLKVSLAGRVST